MPTAVGDPRQQWLPVDCRLSGQTLQSEARH
jgi:hypothetical protein